MEIKEFLTENNKIKAELLDTEALKVAEEFKKSGISTNQLRMFYDEVKKYETSLKNNKKNFNEIEPLIYMMKSKAKYKLNSKIEGMDTFYDFISKSFEIIKKASDEKTKQENYKAFCLFFEAIYGFADLKKGGR